MPRHCRCNDEHDVQRQQFHIAERQAHRDLAEAKVDADEHGKGENGVEIEAHDCRETLPRDVSAGTPVGIEPRGVGDNQGNRDNENVSAYSAFFQNPLSILVNTISEGASFALGSRPLIRTKDRSYKTNVCISNEFANDFMIQGYRRK